MIESLQIIMAYRQSALLVGLLCLLHSVVGQVHVAQTKVTTIGCGSEFGCMRNPKNCVSPDCKTLVKWKTSPVAGYVDIELMARFVDDSGAPQEPGWVALGLSNDMSMGDDSVSHCVANKSNSNQIDINLSYNWYNASTKDRGNLVLRNPEVTRPLTNLSGSVVDAEIHCRFSRNVQQDGARIYQLNKAYYLLLAFGRAAVSGMLQVHSVTPLISSSQVDLTTSKNIVLSGSQTSDNGGGGNGPPPTSVGTGKSGELTDGLGNDVLYRVTDDGKYVQFTMTRKLSNGNAAEWVALGFSTDKTMKDDSVIECVRLLDGSLVARNSFNHEYHNNRPSVPSNVGIESPSYNVTDGVMTCDFLRPVTCTGSSCSDVSDLNKLYYPLIAWGTVSDSGEKNKHATGNGRVFDKQFNFTDKNAQGGGASKGKSGVTRLKRAHGILMITAWVLLVSTSIIIARYYKTCWHEKKLCTTDVWFSLHRFLMLLALCCTISAFIIIFYVKDGLISNYPPNSPSYFWVHAPLGIVVMILVILNPLMAAFRCHPNTRFRPIFNWLHWFVGTCAHVVALITIFFGIKIGELGPEKICHMAVFWIMIAFVGFHVLIEIILSIDKCIAETRSKSSFQVQYEMSKPGEVPRVLEPPVSSCSVIFRYIILTFYFLIVLGLWLAMIILIGKGKIN